MAKPFLFNDLFWFNRFLRWLVRFELCGRRHWCICSIFFRIFSLVCWFRSFELLSRVKKKQKLKKTHFQLFCIPFIQTHFTSFNTFNARSLIRWRSEPAPFCSCGVARHLASSQPQIHLASAYEPSCRNGFGYAAFGAQCNCCALRSIGSEAHLYPATACGGEFANNAIIANNHRFGGHPYYGSYHGSAANLTLATTNRRQHCMQANPL